MREGARLPVLFVSHGAAVFSAAAEDPTYLRWRSLAPKVASWGPRAVVGISAHFVSEGRTVVTSSARPPLLHDHPATHHHAERYPAPGDPALAAAIATSLEDAGLPAGLDAERGIDHGAWLPLRALLPGAHVPVVMVSLRSDVEDSAHVALGRCLARLRAEGVLVLASGGLTHDQQAFRAGFFAAAGSSWTPGHPVRLDPEAAAPASTVAFEAAATAAVLDAPDRAGALLDVFDGPNARAAHPTPEHFWPLLVAAGAAAGDPAEKVHGGHQFGLSTAAFVFGRA
jgi:4,5-DOPA dioxygenase extradiol